jgi:phospholipid N-methyltransferase
MENEESNGKYVTRSHPLDCVPPWRCFVSVTTFDATYDPADDKLRLRASSRLDDETYARVKAAGFGWAPKQDLFYAVWSPAREDLLAELAGEIGDEETTPEERAAQRAERFEGYKDRRAVDAEQARKSVSAIADGIPLGQPILVGHHSERHARRDAEKIENGMRRAVRLWETSTYWAERAASAIAHARYLEKPAVRARRIKKLEAELRGFRRDTDKAETALKLWAVEPLTLARAKAITNVNHYHACFTLAEYPREPPASQYEGQQSFWAALEDGIITAEQARTLAVAMNQRGIAHRARWIAHLENRLAYERAMLGESGGLKADKFDLQPGGQVLRRGRWHVITKVNRSAGAVRSVTVLGHFAATIAVEDISDYRAPADGAAEKVRAATKLAPMCNYPGEGFRHMTRAEWEHKKMSDVPQAIRHEATEEHGAHRTRATSGGGWTTVAVYLTDAKRVDPPAPGAPEPAPQIATLPPEHSTPPAPRATDPAAEDFAALKATLKAGVQVAVAPQLFPTPPALAKRMVELAEIQPGMCVLEPSAGTGNIVRAVLDSVDTEVLAYEINRDLCSRLSRMFPSYKLQARCRDFLTVTDFQGQYERVLMNPPFSNGQDIAHIKHALTFLRPGGCLVALCANGPRQQAELRTLATTWEELPEGTFAEQGTNVRAALMMVRR